MTTSETRLLRVLDRARQALEQDRSAPRRPGLGDHDFPRPSTRRAALVLGLSPTLVHPLDGRGPFDLVDPSTLQLYARLRAAGRELKRCDLQALLQRLHAQGEQRRARLRGDAEED